MIWIFSLLEAACTQMTKEDLPGVSKGTGKPPQTVAVIARPPLATDCTKRDTLLWAFSRYVRESSLAPYCAGRSTHE